MAFDPLRAFRQQRIVRAFVGLLVLAGAAFALYKLAKVPRPVNVETIENFSPVTISPGQELVIEGPELNSSQGMLFSHDGSPNETVDVIFERARLGEQTIELFEMLGLRLPSTPTSIDYRAQETERPATGGEACRTRVELRATSQMPAEIHLFQRGERDQNYYRRLEMRIRGAELISNLQTMSPDDTARAPGCQYSLGVGDQNVPITKTGVTIIVADDSDLRFSFRRLTTDSTPWADTGGFLPLDLGAPQLNPSDPPFLRARAVSIRQLGGGDSASALPELASARSTSDGPPLTISGLKIGSNQLQLNIAGKGWVKINGEDATVNLLTRVQENPIASALLAAANAALLAWVARLIFKTPSTSPRAKRPEGQSRKSERKRKGGTKK